MLDGYAIDSRRPPTQRSRPPVPGLREFGGAYDGGDQRRAM
jgi:hypothetical protein